MNCNTFQRPVAPKFLTRFTVTTSFAAAFRAQGTYVGASFLGASRLGALLALCGALLLCSCQQGPPTERPIGTAYAGPATLNLRKDLSSRSSPTTSVQHGEVLEILETRRRFVRVRTSQGEQGWTDANLLLSAEQMESLQQLSAYVAALPSEGAATVSEALNVHTEPARQSPSFFQIPENGSVELVGHSVAPRNSPATAVSKIAPLNPVAKKAKAKQTKSALLIPAPHPAGPPANWEQLSRPRLADLPGYTPPPPPPSAPTDDWSLIRTKDGKAGWVLSRMLFMAVPDELAQYAEGRRITAYQLLGDVEDGGKVKHDWIWTTVSADDKCCEFDMIRVFVWSIKRHHYETAYVERNVTGYYPVQVVKVPGNPENGFSLVAQEKDGKLNKRTYAFVGRRVRVISREPYTPAAPLDVPKISTVPQAPVPGKRSLWQRVVERVQAWRGKDQP